MTGTSPTRRSRSELLYAKLLAVYPAAYRREYGPLMLQLFRDLYRDAQRQPTVRGRLSLWWRVAAEFGTTASSEHVEVLREVIMKALGKTNQAAGRIMVFLVAAVLIALGVLAKPIITALGGSVFTATAVTVMFNLIAALLVEWVTQARGAILAMMAIMVGATLLPLLWVPDAAAWLRENPNIGGIFVVLAGSRYQTGRPRWPLFAVAGILAAGQIAVSFI